MTKEQLKSYQPIKKELNTLEVLARKIDRYGTDTLRTLYDEKREKLTDELLHIEQVIEALEPTERTLMRLRYIDGLSWQAICTRINYSWQQTHRIHARALIKIKDK